jgi:acylphosphatase
LNPEKAARRYVVRGRVQGVGYRDFASKLAQSIGISGYVRNRDDGSVEVYAMGDEDQLFELAGALWKGPRWAEVWGVDEMEAPMESWKGFRIRP